MINFSTFDNAQVLMHN